MNRRLGFLLVSCLVSAGALGAQVAVDTTTFHLFQPASGPVHFDLQTSCPQELPPFLHWDLRRFASCRVPYEVNGTIPGGVPSAAAAVAAVNRAAATWTNATPAHIALFNNNGWTTTPCPVAPGQDGRNCVTWDPGFAFAGIQAITCLWFSAVTGEIQEVDIAYDANVAWTAGTTPATSLGIESFALHELGHFLGLGHPNFFTDPLACADDDFGLAIQPVMHSIIPNNSQLTLRRGDRDGINHLYTADLGDLPDPPYPTRVRAATTSGLSLSGVRLRNLDDGPSHLFGFHGANATPRYQYEWLGLNGGRIDDHVNECEALPNDAFDDGVVINAECANGEIVSPLTVFVGVRTAADLMNRRHTYDAANGMFINAFFDFNDNGSLRDPGEHAIGGAANGVRVTAPGVYGFVVPVPPDTTCTLKSRFRLDWREDVGQIATAVSPLLDRETFEAQHGEVEDYVGVPVAPPGGGTPPLPPYCHPVKKSVVFSAFGSRAFIAELCHPPEPDWTTAIATTFPDGASECMNSTLTFTLDLDENGTIDESLGLSGPVCVKRSDPYIDPDDGLKTIDTQMTSLDMSGYSHFLGELRVRLTPNFPSLGAIKQSKAALEAGVDLSPEHPASSYFDVYFVVETQELGVSEPVGPARAETVIDRVPPGKVLIGPVEPFDP